jgi:hypothetical protein
MPKQILENFYAVCYDGYAEEEFISQIVNVQKV